MQSNTDQNLQRELMKAWLDHLDRLLERHLRRGNAASIRTALGIAGRRMKLQAIGGAKLASTSREAEGFPITIFSDAIKEMEKRRGGKGEDS